MDTFDNINSFNINGRKILIFRREADYFVSYDPVKLEIYSVNFIGAEMLYLISEKIKYQDIIKHFTDNYDIGKEEFENDICEFFANYRCKDLIIDKLYKLEFPSVKINV